MADGLNKVMLLGNLGQDRECLGTVVPSMAVALDEMEPEHRERTQDNLGMRVVRQRIGRSDMAH